MSAAEFDYVVVGGGSSGAAVAGSRRERVGAVVRRVFDRAISSSIGEGRSEVASCGRGALRRDFAAPALGRILTGGSLVESSSARLRRDSSRAAAADATKPK